MTTIKKLKAKSYPDLPKMDSLISLVLNEDAGGETSALAILRTIRDKALAGDLKAAELLFDRAYGRAPQHIETSSKDPVTIRIGYGDTDNPRRVTYGGQDVE